MQISRVKGLNLIRAQFSKYINAPISQKIPPLIGFSLYLFIFPFILEHIIPESFTSIETMSLKNQQRIIYMTALILGNVLTVIFYSIGMYFVYTGKYAFFEQYRISPDTLWPWEEDYHKWRILLSKTIKTLFMNAVVLSFITFSIWGAIFQRKIIMDKDQIPNYFTMIWQILLFMIIEDKTSTFTHTLLHSPQLYWIHKKHHEYTTSISISAEYAHSLEFVLSNSLPTIIGFKVLARFYPVHIITAIMWLVLRILITSDVHCGYEWPWDFLKLLPFTAASPYHDFHHSHNTGNFSSTFMIWEALNGNNCEFYQYLEAQKNKKIKER